MHQAIGNPAYLSPIRQKWEMSENESISKERPGAGTMATPPKNVDRRVQRTRQLLRQAFVEVAQEKGLTAVSVQDITERANIHRGTFYTHYEDKYALVYSLIREEIQYILSGKLPPVPQW